MKLSSLLLLSPVCCLAQKSVRPNILIAIADDQSYPHASAYGSTWIYTPAFDRVATEGLLFSNCYACSPGSSPSRASMLTGLFPWQIEEAGTLPVASLRGMFAIPMSCMRLAIMWVIQERDGGLETGKCRAERRTRQDRNTTNVGSYLPSREFRK